MEAIISEFDKDIVVARKGRRGFFKSRTVDFITTIVDTRVPTTKCLKTAVKAVSGKSLFNCGKTIYRVPVKLCKSIFKKFNYKSKKKKTANIIKAVIGSWQYMRSVGKYYFKGKIILNDGCNREDNYIPCSEFKIKFDSSGNILIFENINNTYQLIKATLKVVFKQKELPVSPFVNPANLNGIKKQVMLL